MDGYEDLPRKKSDDTGYGDLPSKSIPKPISTEKPKEKGYDIFEGLKDVATSGGVGAAAGALAPELTSLAGMGMMAFPPTAPFGPFVMGAGRAMRGARLAGATAGGIGGLLGEAGGQAVEAGGGPKPLAEAARFAGGMVGPEAARAVTAPFARAGGYALSTALNKLFPGVGTGARTMGQLLKDRGIEEVNLTQQQRQFIENKIQQIRGGAASLQPLKDIYAILRQAGQQATQRAEQEATQLEAQAQQLLQQAQATGGAITGEAAQRVSRLQSQFEQAAQKIRDIAEKQAKTIREQSELAANAARERAATQAPEMRQAAEQEANQIIQSGRQQADALLSQSKERTNRLQQTLDKVRQSSQRAAAVAPAERAAVGEPMLPTQLGKQVRQTFDDVVSKLKATREQNVEKFKTAAFGEAQSKEQAGKRYTGTNAYREAINGISREIQNPETKLLNVPEGEIRNSLMKVMEQLQGGQMSFQGLETLRRSLRDRAFGLPSEGYDAIGQQQAGRLAEYVENIQKEFSPGFAKYLEQYKKDSQPLNEFKSRLGKAVVGKEEFDMSQFSVDAAKLGPKVFESASTVEQLIKLAGPQQAEQLARGFLADKLRTGGAKEIASAIRDSRDWIGQFPQLAAQLNAAAERVGIAERVGAKRSTLAKTLRTEMGALPVQTQRMMTRAEEDAARKAAATVKAGEAQAGKVMTAAEREAAGLTTAAEREAGAALTGAETQISASAKSVERQRKALEEEAAKRAGAVTKEAEAKGEALTGEAGKVRAAAQDFVNVLLSGKTAPERVRDWILGSSAKEWEAISPIIASTPGGKEKMAEAVGQVIANRAEKSLKGAIQDMEMLGDKLVSNNLMSQAAVDKLNSQLREIFVAPISGKEKATMSQRLVRNAIAGYVAPGVERGAEAGYKLLTE